MKLKKAKKMLKELGISSIIIKDKNCSSNNDEPDIAIKTGETHKLDDAKVIRTSLSHDDFEIIYEKPSTSKKKKKAKKKARKKCAYDDEVARIQRNLHHLETGEGQYEESAEQIAKREEQMEEQAARQRKYPPKGNHVNQSGHHSSGNSHHQNPEANHNNRRRYNRNQNSSSSNESGTKEITNKPDYSNEKEE